MTKLKISAIVYFMTIIDTIRDTNKPPMPVVSTEVFEDAPKARYWIGKVAVGEHVILPEYFEATGVLRANVYIDEMHFLEPEHRDENGREFDEDDHRSIQFAVVEKTKDNTSARVVGISRLVEKRDDDDLLPIEKLFPEVFASNPAKNNSVEVSRFIARHEKEFTQHLIALSVIRAMTHHSVKNNIDDVYCVIEEPLYKLLSIIGLPMTLLAEPKKLDEYNNTENMAIVIDPRKVIEQVTRDKTGQLPLTQFFAGEDKNQGLGYYASALIGGGNVQ